MWVQLNVEFQVGQYTMNSGMANLLAHSKSYQTDHKKHIELSIMISNIISSSVTANSNQPWSVNISPFLMKFEPAWMESSNHRRGSDESVIFILGTSTVLLNVEFQVGQYTMNLGMENLLAHSKS